MNYLNYFLLQFTQVLTLLNITRHIRKILKEYRANNCSDYIKTHEFTSF